LHPFKVLLGHADVGTERVRVWVPRRPLDDSIRAVEDALAPGGIDEDTVAALALQQRDG
jgi:hypothetical protein